MYCNNANTVNNFLPLRDASLPYATFTLIWHILSASPALSRASMVVDAYLLLPGTAHQAGHPKGQNEGEYCRRQSDGFKTSSRCPTPRFIPQGSENVVSQVYNRPAGYQGKNQRPEPPPDFGFKIHGQIGRDYRSGSHHEKIPPFHINVFSKQNKPRYRKNRNQECQSIDSPGYVGSSSSPNATIW